MKQIKIYTLILAGLLGAITSCKDDSIELVPAWESAVHGYSDFAEGSAQNFVFNDPTTPINVDLQWISIDGRADVSKIDVYVLVNETYVDPTDGNTKVAQHGGDEGRLLTSFEGSAVPASRVPLTFSLDQAAVYNLYQDAQFDYGNGAVPVFANPDKPERDAVNRFTPEDQIVVRWDFTTADGRVFSKWGPSVCTEFPGANCELSWGVICVSDLAGTYNVVSTFDSPGYFNSENPDFQYGPGNDGSVGGGVQTYNGIGIAAGTATSTYVIPDITNGFEPIMWGNPPVLATVADQCGKLVAVSITFAPYGYEILPGSKVNPDGTFTIVWQNVYGENGISTFTPQ